MKDYGTASHKEIIEGIEVATRIAKIIRALPNPAVQNMVKKLIELIQVQQ